MSNKPVIDFEYDPIVKGPCAIVAYARRTNGRRPAKDYIEGLEREDQAKLAKSFIKITRVMRISNQEKFRKLGGASGKVYEFKVHPGIRVLCFQEGKTWYLTHGYNKQTGKTPPKEIRRAETIMEEQLSLLG